MRWRIIIAGVALINRLQWIIYILGAFLVSREDSHLFTAGKDPSEAPAENNRLLRVLVFEKLMRYNGDYVGGKVLRTNSADLYATPLLLVLIRDRNADVFFAADSIPAILASTRDPLIVYTSNVFAIRGLRSFVIRNGSMMELFQYLHSVWRSWEVYRR